MLLDMSFMLFSMLLDGATPFWNAAYGGMAVEVVAMDLLVETTNW